MDIYGPDDQTDGSSLFYNDEHDEDYYFETYSVPHTSRSRMQGRTTCASAPGRRARHLVVSTDCT